jgi:hypothetical protein
VSAVLPPDFSGLAWTAALVLNMALDRISLRFSAPPSPGRPRRSAIPCVVALGMLMFRAIIWVAFAVRHSDGLWLAWTLAGVTFVVGAGGSWIIDRRFTDYGRAPAT